MSAPVQPSLQSVVAAEYDDIRGRAAVLVDSSDRLNPIDELRAVAQRFAILAAAGSFTVAPDQYRAAHDAILAGAAHFQEIGADRTTSDVIAILVQHSVSPEPKPDLPLPTRNGCAADGAMSDDVPVPEHLRPALETVVRRLAAGDVGGLARDGHISYPGDILLWVRNYSDDGATLIPLPPEVWDDAAAQVVSHDVGEWSVEVPLWTAEEGRSDLTLEADVTDRPGGPVVVINDIHVH